ncbi:MAG: MBL fold metallo-hydrolase [Ignavibacteriales bacterium]
MKILNLTEGSSVYTSNVYLVTGTWNAIKDINTLIDVGRDISIIEKIDKAYTGVGKHRVEQIFLTHNHYDHTEILKQIKKIYHAKVYAYSSSLEYVDEILSDGQIFKIGDKDFEVIYAPGHSSDSICLFCKEDGILFAGDNPIIINSSDAVYEKRYLKAIEHLASFDIKKIYFGHGLPYEFDCNKAIKTTLKNLEISNK